MSPNIKDIKKERFDLSGLVPITSSKNETEGYTSVVLKIR